MNSSSSSRVRQLATHLPCSRRCRRPSSSSSSPSKNRTATITTTTTMPTTNATALAPWRGPFLEHVNAMSTPEFTLGTVRAVKNGSGSVTYTPRVRTCIFRGMFADMDVNPKNEAELNPKDMYTSDLPTFTTDVRMDKMSELWGKEVVINEQQQQQGQGQGQSATTTTATTTTTGGGGGGSSEDINGTGGGGLVEATWWAEKNMTQWRIRGTAHVLAPQDVDEEKEEVKNLLLSRMIMVKQKEEEEKKDWSFSREITAHFGNLSPGMRGTFRNPPPGTPVARPVPGMMQKEDEHGDYLALGQKVTELEDPVARANFRVVVIVPHEVDRTDLSDPSRGRRWLYRRLEGGEENKTATMPGGVVEEGGWEKVEVWP